MTIQFDAVAYANTVRLAGNAFRNSDKNSSQWASESLAAIMLDKMNLLTIALKLYSEMKPLNAKGKPVEPKENDNGTISVSSLRGGGDNTCNGGDAARKAFDKLQYIVNNVDVMPEQTTAFAISPKGTSLDALVNTIKAAKAEAAKAEAANDDGAEDIAEREGDEEPASDGPNYAEKIAEFNAMLLGIDARDLDDAAQLALVQTMNRIAGLNADLVNEAELAEQAAPVQMVV